MDLKILVATHKQYWMPKDSCYVPIHVGREGKSDIGYMGDNTGDHISGKNLNYCELTGLYWAWKNLICEYIGLCHYRRYFSKHKFYFSRKGNILKKKDFEKILCKYDVILPKITNLNELTIREQYEKMHMKKDLDCAETVLKEQFPLYSRSFDKVMNQHKMYSCNMFVMKKKDFDRYCEWLFPILFEVEKCINISGYSPYQTRVFGFLSERLFNVWLDYHKFNSKAVRVIHLEDK